MSGTPIGERALVSPLARLPFRASAVVLREAVAGDVPAVAELLTEAPGPSVGGGAARGGDLRAHLAAFGSIVADPAHLLVVAVDGETRVVGVMHWVFVPELAGRGRLRAQLELVRVAHSHRTAGAARDGGLGRLMVAWGIDHARCRGCTHVQVVADRHRNDLNRFYAALGFVQVHRGWRLAVAGRRA